MLNFYNLLVINTCNCCFNCIFCAIQTGIDLICIISSHVSSSFDKFSDKSGSIEQFIGSGMFVDNLLTVLVAALERVLVRLLSVVLGSFLIRFVVAKYFK